MTLLELLQKAFDAGYAQRDASELYDGTFELVDNETAFSKFARWLVAADLARFDLVLGLAEKIGACWREDEGVNSALLDELELATRAPADPLVATLPVDERPPWERT